jgi:hypothetical protein
VAAAVAAAAAGVVVEFAIITLRKNRRQYRVAVAVAAAVAVAGLVPAVMVQPLVGQRERWALVVHTRIVETPGLQESTAGTALARQRVMAAIMELVGWADMIQTRA